MKKITAIVRPEKLEPLKEALFAAQVSGNRPNRAGLWTFAGTRRPFVMCGCLSMLMIYNPN